MDRGHDRLSHDVIGCALEVHSRLGPGLLESTYERCLAHELGLAGIPVQLQVPIPVRYRGLELDCGFRVDMVVKESLLVELKSVKQVADLHAAQLLTYLKLSGIGTGLLLNFNVIHLRDGIRRLVR